MSRRPILTPDLGVPVPRSYRCVDCGARGCKLWREYQTFANHTRLLCVDCTGKAEKQDITAMTEDGFLPAGSGGRLMRTDSVGWFVPAVPAGRGDFWGYTSTPDHAIAWWRARPLRAAAPRRRAS